MKDKKNLVFGVLCLALGVFLISSDGIIQGKSLFAADNLWSQADSYIRALGWILIVLSLVLIIRAFLKNTAVQRTIGTSKYLIIFGFAAMVVYALLLPLLGFILDSLWFVAVITFLIMSKEKGLTKSSDKKQWLRAAAVSCSYSVILVFVMYFAFTKLLKVILP